jgi:hypothetical protein
MPGAVRLTAAAVLLITPTVLAFHSGGYFDRPRLVAGLVVWALVLAAAVVSPRPLPRSLAGRVALAGLALIALWTGVSIVWAPLSDPATDSFVRLLLYLGVLAAAAALLADRLAAQAVEPVLALGALVVIGYALAGRLLPDLFELAESRKAFGRLEQPITYWNAQGALAAFGLVLAARLAGDTTRPVALRVAAAAGAPVLGLGVYLTYSRGAIAATAVGLLVLLAAAPTRAQLWAAGSAFASATLISALAAFFPAVASLEGGPGTRSEQGAIVLALLLLLLVAVALLQLWRCRGGHDDRERLSAAGRLPALAAAVAAVCLLALVAGGIAERGSADQDARRGISRLTSIDSSRYNYWRVGLDAWTGDPLRGAGAGAFRVEWLRERPVAEGALEVHSLPLEMLIELGIVGLFGFVMLIGGVAFSCRRALTARAPVAPGLSAAATVFLLHASIDWDWQVPAVALPALIAAGALVAAAEEPPTPARADSTV